MSHNKPKVSQVFLVDGNIKRKIVKELNNFLKINTNQICLEIGLGEGDMTKHLLDLFSNENILGVEVDPKLANYVSDKFNINVINQNFLEIDSYPFDSCVLISNIPYHLTTKFIEKFILNLNFLKTLLIGMMLQKEAFQRLKRADGIEFYAFNHFFQLKKQIEVKKNCFKPIPKVDSMFSIWELKNGAKDDSFLFLKTLKLIAHKKNKTIKNNLLLNNENLINNKLIDKEWIKKRFFNLSDGEKKEVLKFFY